MKTEKKEQVKDVSMLSKKKKIIIGAVTGLVILCTAGGTYYASENKVVSLEKIVIEYGEGAPTRTRDYFSSGRFVDVTKGKLDISMIDIDTVGTYEVTLTIDSEIFSTAVEVQDTTAPVLQLIEPEEGYKTIVGKELNASDIIASVEDLAGIESVVFAENQIEQTEIMLNEENVPSTKLIYNEVGEYENTIIVTDKHGVTSETKIQIHVVEDYLAHVQGLQDFTIEVGTEMDFMRDVMFGEKVKEVTIDSTQVDVNAEGTYTLVYLIKGDDEVTEVKQEQSVTVVAKTAIETIVASGVTVTTTSGERLDTTNYASSNHASTQRQAQTSNANRGGNQSTSNQNTPAPSGNANNNVPTNNGNASSNAPAPSSNANTSNNTSNSAPANNNNSGGGSWTFERTEENYKGPNESGGHGYGDGGIGDAPWN